MLAQFEQVQLLLRLIPVAANALEAGGAIVQCMSGDADFGIAHGNDAAFKVGIAFFEAEDGYFGSFGLRWMAVLLRCVCCSLGHYVLLRYFRGDETMYSRDAP